MRDKRLFPCICVVCSWIAEKQKRHEEDQRKKRKDAVKGRQSTAGDGQAPQQAAAGPQTSITVDPLLS